MDRSAAVRTTSMAFVKWEEVFSTNHRGRREVRYYLKRRDGTSDLAVVGKEKKLGHNTKTSSSSSCRYRYEIRDKSLFSMSNLSFEIFSKLRSRREVIDLLTSVVSDGSFNRPPQRVNGFLGSEDNSRLNKKKLEDVDPHKKNPRAIAFLWLGSAWTCKKKRKHYEAYSRNGVRISVHDFVYVLAEENKRLIAYLNDMYEDTQTNKMAVVRWFHKVDEVHLDLPHSYNDKEIFFSLSLQDLSIECVDGLATVLSPQHYDKFIKADPTTKIEPFVCRNLFDNQDFKPFDITQVKGYWKQNILKSGLKLRISDDDNIGVRPRKRLRRLIDTEKDAEYGYLQKGSQIEVLSQDSGIRGLWFRAVVIKMHKDKLKVRYEDIKDADDESINLEEWILSSRIANPDQLGIRHSGRLTIRPTRSSNNSNASLINIGSIVDAWLHDGWWEGIVINKESDDKIHVYFPGEKQRSIMGCKDLRKSEEWLGDRWKQMKNRPDLLSSISPSIDTNPKTTKSHENVSTICDDSLENNQNINLEVVNDRSKEDLESGLNWNWATKKRNSHLRRQRDVFNNNINLKVAETRKHNCKLCDSSLFCGSVASRPLTSLVMSR